MNLRPAITSIAPLMETIQEQLLLSSTAASLLTAIPVLCMGIFAPLASKLGKFGLERILAGCLLLIAAATGLRYAADNAALLLWSAGLIGVGVAVAGPSLSGFIKLHFPAQTALMIGIYSIGIGLGASLGAGLTIPLQRRLADDWSAALAVWAVLAMVSILFWVYATRSSAARAGGGGKPAKNPFPWKNKRAVLVMLFFGLQACLTYSITAWLAPFSQANRLSPALSGSVVTLYALVQVGAGVIAPLLVSRFPNRRFWTVSSCCTMLAGLLMISVLNHASVPWISAVLMGYGSGALFFWALLLPLEETDHAEEASAWTSMAQCGGYIMAASGPTLTGWIHDLTGSYPDAFAGLALICLLLVAVSLTLSGGRRREARAGRTIGGSRRPGGY